VKAQPPLCHSREPAAPRLCARPPSQRIPAQRIPSPRMPSRRMVLGGLGGAVLGLPLLESLRARAADAEVPHYAVFVRQANGVAQQALSRGESEQQSDRAVSELAPYADRLLMVKGTCFADETDITLRHPGGGNQVLTAAMVSEDLTGTASRAMGESVDNYLARHFEHLGGEPLTLYTGPRDGYLEEVLSYRGPYDLRPAEDDPWTAYLRMVGGEQLDGLLEDRRRSVNDLVRDQMQALMGRPELSQRDKQRLELHSDGIRDFEVLACRLSEDEEQAMATLSGQGTLNSNRILVAQMQCDLLALALSCDYARAATLQLGDGMDTTQFTVDGRLLPTFHQISHRIYGDGMVGEPIEGADVMHHEIDRIHLRIYRHLLDKLDAYGILDQSVVVMTNDIGVGVTHTYSDIPWLIAGVGDGTLRTGQFVDVRRRGQCVTHNQLLNTLITAAGLRKGEDRPVDDFGDPTLERGVLSELIA
jgi:hypothetical protein